MGEPLRGSPSFLQSFKRRELSADNPVINIYPPVSAFVWHPSLKQQPRTNEDASARRIYMNRILIGCGMVLTIALTAVLVGFGSNNGVRTDAEISAMISRIDPSQIQNTVNTL